VVAPVLRPHWYGCCVATEPIASESLEGALARFDTLIDQLSSATEEAQPEPDVLAPLPEEEPQTAEPVRAGPGDVVLQVKGLLKSFGDTVAVDRIDLNVRSGTIFGVVGPNGAGKTTTLSMITGLLRPDAGEILLAGTDVWASGSKAKREMGILPDRLILFDRLTGRQLLHYAGLLHGLDPQTVKARTADLISTIGLDEAQHRLVTDYSAGMTKKVALAAAMIHAPRLLVLDEPFESVDTVSAERIIDILNRYVAAGGTVILSSHSMDLIERICDAVAVIVDGRILAAGAVADVRGDQSLEERFVDLVKVSNAGEDLEWLRSFSD
jgi:ABC-2 type transport system ATP-binding protein